MKIMRVANWLFRRECASIVSSVCCVLVGIYYQLQPDSLAVITLVPAWCWLVLGIILTGIGFRRERMRSSVLAAILWVSFSVAFVEEFGSALRFGRWPTNEWVAARKQGRAFRVISLNCNVGNPRSAAEVAKYEPDIVLLQESPSRAHLAKFAHEMFGDGGSSLWGGDTAILARGRMQPRVVDTMSHFVQATVTLPEGIELEVMSIRLHPPVFRLDFWSSEFWNDHRDNRVKHRLQILQAVDALKELSPSSVMIVGGDFNAPPNDAALWPLRKMLFDTFQQAGTG